MDKNNTVKKEYFILALLLLIILACIITIIAVYISGNNGGKENPSETKAPYTSEPSNTASPKPSGNIEEGTPEPSEAVSPTPSETASSTPAPTPTPTPVPENTPDIPYDPAAKIIYRGNSSNKKIAFSINVAWGEEYIPEIIDILDRYGITTTFMIQGYWANYLNETGCPEYFQSIVSHGQEVGMHGWGHDDARTLEENGNLARLLMKNHDKINELSGLDPVLYAPPSGYVNDAVAETAASCGFKTIIYTVDSLDWKAADGLISEEEVYNNIMSGLCNGAIILVHPTQALVSILPRVIEEARNMGYTVTTVSDCIA